MGVTMQAGGPMELGSICIEYLDKKGVRIMMPGKETIVYNTPSEKTFFSAYWRTQNVSPEQMVDAVRLFFADLAEKVPPQTESHYSFGTAKTGDEVEAGPIPLKELLEGRLTPNSVQHFFRIYSSGVDVWAVAEGTAPLAGIPPIAGILSNHSLPLEPLLRFYHSTSGLDQQTPPNGLGTLEEVMRNFKPL